MSTRECALPPWAEEMKGAELRKVADCLAATALAGKGIPAFMSQRICGGLCDAIVPLPTGTGTFAHELVAIVRRNATEDRERMDQARASLCQHINRLLAKHHHHRPDWQGAAVVLVMQKIELFASEVAA